MATSYLSLFPKPVLDDLVNGRWLPIVGAGMSLNALLPPGRKMPTWDGLGKALISELPDHGQSSPIEAVSAYEHEFGRARLIERISDLLMVREAYPGDAHRSFCTIPFDIVCTTNFDFLLERQYELIPRFVYPVVDEGQLSIGVGEAGTLLLKVHGDLHNPGRLIATEADYDGYLSASPLMATYLSNHLITRTAFFIGYSLEDPDFRQLWHVVSSRLGKTRRKAYSIGVSVSASEIARFERRGVRVINLPGSHDRYGEILASCFRELVEYLRDNVLRVSKVTNERALRELLLPRDAETRLCYFAISLDLLPLYREKVFPIVEEAGFVPLTADDVVTPGNANAKIDALIDRSAVVVVDTSSGWVSSEYRMALSRASAQQVDELSTPTIRLVLIVPDGEQIPPNGQQFEIIRRPDVTGDDAWVLTLGRLLSTFSPRTRRPSEPRRLFESGEFRAAVISAMALLEEALRDKLGRVGWTEARRPFSLRSLVDQAYEASIIGERNVAPLREWIQLRNEVVHSSKNVPKRKAQEVVDGVAILLSQL